MRTDVQELLDGDATGVADAIRGGEVSATEVVEAALARVEERNPALNAIVEHRAEAALAAFLWTSCVLSVLAVPFSVDALLIPLIHQYTNN